MALEEFKEVEKFKEIEELRKLINKYSNVYDFKNKEYNIMNKCLLMLDRSISNFEWSGLPESLPAEILEKYLQIYGKVFIMKDNEGEIRAFNFNPGATKDVYFRPKTVLINNPWANINGEFKVGEDGFIIKNDSNGVGVWPVFTKYAALLTENDLTVKMAIINSRAINLISAPDDRTLKAINEYINNLVNGDYKAVGEAQIFDGIKVQPLMTEANNTLTNLIEMEQYLKASWFNEIGINANYNMKRESLNSAESDLNSECLYPLIDDELHNRQESEDKFKEMFGLDVKVEWHNPGEHIKNQLLGIDPKAAAKGFLEDEELRKEQLKDES